jgi:exopolyphosphatase/guanosine-5'-triphosphate,3'-diphosphate pyrophosphatase
MPERVHEGGLVAAVDCGSNSTRLLIAGAGPPVTARARVTRITRLADGVDASGRLSDAAIGRVSEVLTGYVETWRAWNVDRVGVSATSAVRDAADRDRFLDAVHAATGVRPVVLSGHEEAALTFAGATAGRSGRHVVCDIGGGSTELCVGDGELDRAVSLQVGSVRLRERHLLGDPPAPAEYAALVAGVDAELAAVPDAFDTPEPTPLIAVAGTALTVAAVARDATDADIDRLDGTVLSVAEVRRVVEDLAWVTAVERLTHPAIAPGREDVIVAGALVLARVMARLHHVAVEVRLADLLDGVAARVASGTWPPRS